MSFLYVPFYSLVVVIKMEIYFNATPEHLISRSPCPVFFVGGRKLDPVVL
jgi:hypothetical protein